MTPPAFRLRSAIARELPACVKRVRQYIPLRRYPTIFIVSVEDGLVLNGRRLPDWIRALTIGQDIYVIAQPTRWSALTLRRMLCHEVFHAAIHAYFGSSTRVPYWLNEALAHSLAAREFGTAGGLRWLPGVPENWKNFVRSTALHLARNHTPGSVRAIMKHAKRHGGFDPAICALLGVHGPRP